MNYFDVFLQIVNCKCPFIDFSKKFLIEISSTRITYFTILKWFFFNIQNTYCFIQLEDLIWVLLYSLGMNFFNHLKIFTTEKIWILRKKGIFPRSKSFWNNVEERELTTHTAEILIFSHFFHIPLGSAIFHNLHGIICHQDWNHFWWDWEDERWKKGKLCLVTCLSSCDSDTMERATNDPCVILLLSLQPWWCRCHHRLRRQSQWNENGKKKISITENRRIQN